MKYKNFPFTNIQVKYVKNFISAEEQQRAQLESVASTHTMLAPLDSLGLPESTVMRRREASSS